jgi:hypothetical protein
LKRWQFAIIAAMIVASFLSLQPPQLSPQRR